MCAWAFGDSYDCYAAPADAVLGYWDSGTVGTASLSAGRFAGSQAWSTPSTATAVLVKSSGSNDAVHHISVAFRQTAVLSGSTLGLYLQFSDGATNQCCIVFRQDGTILLTSATPAGTVLATYAGAVTAASTWFQFEFEVVINNVSGSFKVRKNGATSDDHSTTSINTRPGANAYANKLTLGMQASVNAHATDDLLWRSDAASVPWVGDVRCITRMPASEASVQFSTAGVRSFANTGVSTTTGGANKPYYATFTPTFAGTIATVTVNINIGTYGGNLKCGLYADTGVGGGTPGTVIGTATNIVSAPPVAGTYSFTFSPPIAVTAGQKIWVGFCGDAAGNILTSSGSGTASYFGSTTYASFPAANPTGLTATPAITCAVLLSATNFAMVNEPQQNTTTDYVYDSVVGHSDLYGIAAIASTPVASIAVTVRAFMQKSDAGTRGAAVQLKSGATTVASSGTTLSSSSWGWAWRTELTDPANGSAWTAVAVNNVQVGPVVTV